jgi:hypothetical protein
MMVHLALGKHSKSSGEQSKRSLRTQCTHDLDIIARMAAVGTEIPFGWSAQHDS